MVSPKVKKKVVTIIVLTFVGAVTCAPLWVISGYRTPIKKIERKKESDS